MGDGFLSSLGGWLKDGDNLKGLGTVLGAGGSIYGGIQQSKAANAMIDLENEKFAFNKGQILLDNEDAKRQKQAYARAYGTGVVAL